MACKIFLNYRRGDDPGFVHALLSQLEKTFPPEQVFMDVDSIAPGIDFVEVLDEQIARCAVMLALIGRGWLDAKDASGQRLLDKADDFVRIEIVSALRHGKRVIPVLLHGAEMPRAEALPKPLKPLARRNAVRLTHERFKADVQGLIKAIENALGETAATAQRAASDTAEETM